MGSADTAEAIVRAAGLKRTLIEASGNGPQICLLYTSDAADERSSVDLGGRRIIKKKKYIISSIGAQQDIG